MATMGMQAMKRCTGCKEEKPLTEFHRRRNGFRPQCKSCVRTRDAKRRLEHGDLLRAYDHARLDRFKTPEARERHRAYHRAWRARHPDHRSPSYGKPYGKKTDEAMRAHQAVYRAVRAGKLMRPDTCPRCGRSDSRIEASHTDYSQPLAIEWLCAHCHRAEDRRGKGKGGWRPFADATK
jgi:hypothetical protein